jgi:hypothetical protein
VVSSWRVTVDIAAMVDVEDVDSARVLVDAVHDPVGSPPGTMAAGQRAEQGLADAMWVDRERRVAELQHRRGHGLGQPLGNCPSSGWLEADFVAGRSRNRRPLTLCRAVSHARKGEGTAVTASQSSSCHQGRQQVAPWLAAPQVPAATASRPPRWLRLAGFGRSCLPGRCASPGCRLVPSPRRPPGCGRRR